MEAPNMDAALNIVAVNIVTAIVTGPSFSENYRVQRELKSIAPKIPVIVVVDPHADRAGRRAVTDGGAFWFIMRPLRPIRLKELLNEAASAISKIDCLDKSDQMPSCEIQSE